MDIRRLRGARYQSCARRAASFAAWLRDHLGSSRPVFVSDNPAYDWQWIVGLFDLASVRPGSA